MSGSTARLSAIDAVKRYQAPAVFFPPAEAPGEIFGANVFTKTKHAGASAEADLQVADGDHRAGEAARSDGCRCGGRGDEGLGDGEGCDPLRARLLPADRPHRREARQLPRAGGDGSSIAEFSGKTLIQGEPDASSFPNGGLRDHVRSARLHGLGRDQPRIHPREPERQHALHPDRVRVDDRRSARPQDAVAAFTAGDGQAGRARARACSVTRIPTRSCRSPAPSRSTS